jgi:TRAP-type C4-dicarboxylate transport system substrate-binding protein
MMSFLRTLSLAAAVAVGAILATPATSAAATQWIMATGYPETNFLTKNVRMFIEEVEKETKGGLKITLHSNDTLIKLDSIKRAVQAGQVQIGEIRLGVYGNEDPMFIVDGTPFLASDYPAAWRLMEVQKPYFDKIFKAAGMRVVGYQPWPGQGFYTKMPVNTADDFKGKKLRIYSTATKKMGDLMGFNAVILPFAEIPQAFSTGMIEALFTSPQTGIDIQAWDNTKHFINAGAIFSKNAIIVNDKAHARLPADVQKVLAAAGERFTKRAWEMSASVSTEQMEILRKNGMTVGEAPPAVIQKMKEVGQVMIQDWKSTAPADAIAAIDIYMRGEGTASASN